MKRKIQIVSELMKVTDKIYISKSKIKINAPYIYYDNKIFINNKHNSFTFIKDFKDD